MHLLEHLHRNVKTVAMPTAMVVGALLCRPISALEELSGQMITPTLIFLMLFVTFCRVKPSQMKPSMLHVWLLLVQTVACIGVFLLLRPLDLILAQGAMVCVLAPVAMAAVVIGGMLGANVATMATYSLLCNMAVALLAPVILTFTGTGACTFAQILARIAPLLVMPFAAAQFCRLVIPKAAKWVGDHSQISFYMWLAQMYHVKDNKKYIGEKYDMNKAHEICERYKEVLPNDVEPCDVYVAINAQYHDYAKLFEEWFGGNIDNKVFESAITFWFKDVDFDGDKVWEYFHMNN